MSSDTDKINPYASPAPEMDLSFRDTLKQQQLAIRQERSRRSAICMCTACGGVIFATLLLHGQSGNAGLSWTVGTVMMLVSIGLFFFGQPIWTLMRPIQK